VKKSFASLTNLLVFLYPLLVYFGLGHFEPKYLALLLLLILAARLSVSNQMSQLMERRYTLLLAFAGIALVVVTFVSNSSFGLKLYPLLINLGLLAVFAYSLKYPPTVIERIARLSDPELPESAILYTRQVTRLWCGFFIVNGLISFYTSLFSSIAIWTLYNGLIAYALIGILLAAEYLYRLLIVKRR
jgi:uncharacterized membrane protein